MTHILKPHENNFLLVYLDDVVIFSNSLEEHLQHIDHVLTLLEKHDIRLRLAKCWFGKSQLEYLGHTVSELGLQPSPNKIKAVSEWPRPKSVQQVQQFLGFCNFYRRYVRRYSHIAAPLYKLTEKKSQAKPFQWKQEHQSAFHMLKAALCSAPVLRNPKCGKDAEFIIATDASKYAIGAVLLQKDDEGDIHPCAFYTKVLQSNQTHYPTYQQELLGIVCAVQTWRCYIEGSKKITCITDHATLRHLTDTKNLTALTQRRFNLWADILQPYIATNPDTNEQCLEIVYRKGSDNDADALSRRPDLHYAAAKCDEFVNETDLEVANEFFSGMCHLQLDSQLLHKIKSGYLTDAKYSGHRIPNGVIYDDTDGLYWMADKICIPNDPELKNLILHEYHDALGHPDPNRTKLNVQRMFGGIICLRILRHTASIVQPAKELNLGLQPLQVSYPPSLSLIHLGQPCHSILSQDYHLWKAMMPL